MGSRQIESDKPAWGEARERGAPSIAKPHQAKAMDPSKGRAPNSGQTKGGSPQGGRSSNDSGKKS